MAENIDYMLGEQQPVCAERDWNCMLQSFYEGYVIIVEAVVQTGVDAEGNPIIDVYGMDVTGFTNQEIEDAIQRIKSLYPNAVEYRVHYCGNYIGRPCKMYKV